MGKKIDSTLKQLENLTKEIRYVIPNEIKFTETKLAKLVSAKLFSCYYVFPFIIFQARKQLKDTKLLYFQYKMLIDEIKDIILDYQSSKSCEGNIEKESKVNINELYPCRVSC